MRQLLASGAGFLVALALPSVHLLAAQSGAAGGSRPVDRIATVALDNDLFALRDSGPPTDRDFTHGVDVTVAWQAMPDRIRRWLRLGPDGVCGAEEAVSCLRFAAGARQAIYTPASNEDRRRVGERPHAGYLGAHASLTRVSAHRQLRWRLEVGTTGRPALGAPLQRAMHEITGSSQQRGWQFELGARPVLDVAVDDVWQRDLGGGGVHTRLEGAWSLQAGTLRTAAAVEGAVRLAVDRARLHLPTDGAQGLPRGPFVTLAVRQELVARDLFIDGHFGDRSITTRRESDVWQTVVGLGWRFAGGMSEYRHVRRGREYAAQLGPHSYGSLRFTWYHR